MEPYWEGRLRFRRPAAPDPFEAHKVVAHSEVFAGSCKVFWTDLRQREQEEQGREQQQEQGQVCLVLVGTRLKVVTNQPANGAKPPSVLGHHLMWLRAQGIKHAPHSAFRCSFRCALLYLLSLGLDRRPAALRIIEWMKRAQCASMYCGIKVTLIVVLW